MECVNKNIVGRTRAEILEKNKIYNLAHAEDITNYNIEYRATHKDKIKTYRDDHKLKMNAYQLAYRQAKKANIIDV